ncbi:hypothetical protein MKX01_036056 [Papaver californicum]|nr:hypothetical protein MKX01_036056 [Papaver californicum]
MYSVTLWNHLQPLLTVLVLLPVVNSEPQTNLLGLGCRTWNATRPSAFLSNCKALFSDLREKLSSSNISRFATAEISIIKSDPVYGLSQCRNYLSYTDCLTCFSTAVFHIRNCSSANGARVTYDGCFLRYESNSFFDQTTLQGNSGTCDNKTSSQKSLFSTSVAGLLSDLLVATSNVKGFFAATRKIVKGSNNFVYGVAQCVITVDERGCKDCLIEAHESIEICAPSTNATAVDAGCFMRYSDKAFFSAEQTMDLTPFLKAKGNILGATELRGPVNYGYKDLKSATGSFSEANKLGEGGFGDVYKGILRNGNIVAVKKLAFVESRRAKIDFESEVKLISNVQHRNIIRLLGCCNKRQELLLVYEYMANSSVDRFLYGEKRGSLNWKQRFSIVVGIARGLSYLHHEFHSCIRHRDIKSIVVMLLSRDSLELRPTRPTFIDASNRVRGDTPTTNTGSSMSNATVSLTEVYCR